MKKNFTIIFITLMFFTGLFLPSFRAQAQFPGTELPFGGIVSVSLPCSCSGTSWIWFTPLYLGGPVVVTGPLAYSPFSSLLYANFSIGVPTKWHLGSYVPAVQACWIPVVVGCIPLPTVGLITKVGTN